MQLVDHQPTTRTFTTRELARLAAYRAAVAAGFFSDWDGSAAQTDTEVLARLPRADVEGYPFMSAEREALEGLRRRVSEGEFADDGPGDGS